MDNNNDSREIAEIVENALSEFRQGMEAREQLSTRTGNHTTQIIRFGMFGLSILGLALFYLIFILTKDFATITDEMGHMSVNLTSIKGYFSSLATDMNLVMGHMAGIVNLTSKPMKMLPFQWMQADSDIRQPSVIEPGITRPAHSQPACENQN